MITGKRVGSGMASRSNGTSVAYTIVVPDRTNENLTTIAKTAALWRDLYWDYLKISVPLANRAKFADEVLGNLGETLRLGVLSNIVAQTNDGELLGAASWSIVGQNKATINLVTVSPLHIAGSPGTGQVRGIGTAMVAVVSRMLLTAGVTTVYLRPFDREAMEFWRRRGFMMCGNGHLLCIRSRESIERLINGCMIQPDHPGNGEQVICGMSEAVKAYTTLKDA